MTKEQIKLHSDRAERFRKIRDDLRKILGYEPSKAEAIGLIMSYYDIEESDTARDIL